MRKTLFVFLLLVSTAAMAERPTKEQVDNACGEDIANYCDGLEKRELMRCLKQNKDSISEGCHSFLKEARKSRRGKKQE